MLAGKDSYSDVGKHLEITVNAVRKDIRRIYQKLEAMRHPRL